ncbi:hypothetical protein [Rhodoferax sp.]|uniref:hypothetical protein n=1 Tax=Rhodoferax sp. TaxID=50421 RepID=UPI002762A9F8|nr:hypothetical protein [Rhodoferax sp.]
MKPRIKIGLLLLCLSAACAAQSANSPEATPDNRSNPARAASAPAPPDREQIGRRLVSLATLIEKSSAARQIESSANPQVAVLRGKARELRQQADQAYQAGDLIAAARGLDQAAKMFFEGVRLAAPEQVTGEKEQRDFDNRMESVRALLVAQKRISAEKRQGAKGAEITLSIESKIRDAAALAAGGKLDQARLLLDQVYRTTNLAIEGLRQGDTLVRSLTFATKQEEYLYEVDRNDTHKMLIKVLLDERRASNAGLETMVRKYMEQAASLRANAEGMAAKQDFESAIKLLEDSTRELVRAIRGAGVYIPG